MNTATAEKTTNGKASTSKSEGHALAAIREIPMSLVDESKTNPRKTFVHVEELAADVGVHGILQNLLLRPKKGGRFEVVFGARRYRAAKIAKLETIPAAVRELDDATTLELQIVENSHREDVHPLEEADGYQTLHEKYGHSVEEIAAKVGKSTAHVYARLKFATLIPEARQAFFDGKLTAATALLVARVPDEGGLQKKALEEVTRPNYEKELPTLAQAKHIVKEKFTLRLVDAPFDRSDATLVPAAGPCTTCPKRTGNQKDLFADLETKDDLCTDPKCFAKKREADAEKKIAAAKEAGQEVLLGKKAKDLFAYGRLKHDSGFIDLSEKTYNGGDKETTNRALLKKAAADIPVVLAKDPDGKLRELVDAKAFNKATKKKAASEKPTKAELARQKEVDAFNRKTEREQAKQAQRVVDVVEKAERRQPNDAFWRTLARVVTVDNDFALEDILARRGLAPTEESDTPMDVQAVAFKAIAEMSGAKARGFVVEVLVAGYAGAGDSLLEFEGLYGTAKKPIKRKR